MLGAITGRDSERARVTVPDDMVARNGSTMALVARRTLTMSGVDTRGSTILSRIRGCPPASFRILSR